MAATRIPGVGHGQARLVASRPPFRPLVPWLQNPGRRRSSSSRRRKERCRIVDFLAQLGPSSYPPDEEQVSLSRRPVSVVPVPLILFAVPLGWPSSPHTKPLPPPSLGPPATPSPSLLGGVWWLLVTPPRLDAGPGAWRPANPWRPWPWDGGEEGKRTLAAAAEGFDGPAGRGGHLGCECGRISRAEWIDSCLKGVTFEARPSHIRPPNSEGTGMARHDWDWGARPDALMQALYAVQRVVGLHGERHTIPRPAASVSITGAAAGTWLTWLR